MPRDTKRTVSNNRNGVVYAGRSNMRGRSSEYSQQKQIIDNFRRDALGCFQNERH